MLVVGRPELYSGKHKTTGMNVQVAATLDGQLAWISDPIDGSRHDSHCLTEAAVLTGVSQILQANPGAAGAALQTALSDQVDTRLTAIATLRSGKYVTSVRYPGNQPACP